MEAIDMVLLGYLAGSVPFGLLLTRAFRVGDLRNIGSGSIGATNVLRTGRKDLAVATVLLDAGKGALAVLIATRWLAGSAGLAGVGAVLGHCFPLWLRFRGGKGFATAAGVCLALAWPVALVSAGVWAVALGFSRISSVASLAAVLAAPLVAWWFSWSALVPVKGLIALIVVVRHRANLARLHAGTEPKLGENP